jgi:hypothetical protein
MTHLHLTIVVEVYNGTRTKQAEPAFQKRKFWSNEIIGLQTNPRETSCRKIFPMQESGQLILSKARR